MTKCLARLPCLATVLRDTRGVAIIELAAIAPILIGLLVGMSEISTAYSNKLQLQQAAQRTIEKLLNNSLSSSDAEPLKLEAAQAADVSPEAVRVVYSLECGNIPQPDPNTPCVPGQLSARFVTLEITKRYVPLFSTRFLGAQPDGSFILHAKAGARIQ